MNTLQTGHVRGCTGKKKYGSEGLALEVASKRCRKQGQHEVTLWAYKCRSCHCWHLTSQKK